MFNIVVNYINTVALKILIFQLNMKTVTCSNYCVDNLLYNIKLEMIILKLTSAINNPEKVDMQ